MSVPRIVELATRIASNTTKVSDYLTASNIPQPSFDLDTPPSGAVPRNAPGEIVALRDSVLEDTAELRHLMLGPKDYLFTFPVSRSVPQDATSLCFETLH